MIQQKFWQKLVLHINPLNLSQLLGIRVDVRLLKIRYGSESEHAQTVLISLWLQY